MTKRRIIGEEHIDALRRKMQNRLEIFPSDIITAAAQDQAERLGINLVHGPLEKVMPPKTDGAVMAMRALWRRNPKWVAPKNVIAPQAHRIQKLALVGAGGVGGNIAHLAANMDIAEIIHLVDITPGMAEALALDLNHASGVSRSRAHAYGTADLAAVEGADIVVVTAGRPRGAGMTRADLIDINRRVIENVAEAIKTRAPEAIVIVVTNPLDEMTYEMLRATEFPRERILGMAGTLDSSRFRNAIALKADVAVRDVQALTLGSHGEEMAPIVSQSRIKGRPLDVFLSPEQIAECVKDTVTGGGQVVALKKSGSATIAPAHATIEVIDHIRHARQGTVPVSVMLDGEYGLKNVVLGVPCFLGKSGLIEVAELNLTDAENSALQNAASAIQKRLGM